MDCEHNVSSFARLGTPSAVWVACAVPGIPRGAQAWALLLLASPPAVVWFYNGDDLQRGTDHAR